MTQTHWRQFVKRAFGLNRNICGFFIVFLFVACGKTRERADLVFLNGVEPESLDPTAITGQAEGRLILALFEGLTSRDSTGRVGPGMAERWEISPDGLTYRFYLREDARWSNGDPVTAYDFSQSWERLFNPLTASEYAEILFPIIGAESYAKGEIKDFSQVGVHVVNERVLEVRLRQPCAYFLHLCAFPTSFPVHLSSVKKYGIDWIKPGKLVSNGAYQLVDWRINDRILMKKNPFYWRANSVHMKTVEALPISHATTAFNFYASGIADLLLDKGNIPVLLINEIKNRPDFHSAPILATYFFRFNVTRQPFDNPRVRKAIALAIDKNFIVERLTRAREPIAGSFTPPGLEGYRPPQGLSYHLEEAKKLLAQAGYPNGKGFPPIDFLYNKTDLNEEIATAFQAMMKSIGLQVQLRNQEWKVYLSSLTQLDFDMARSSWVGDYPDPNTFLDCFVTGRGNNRTGWSNAEYDRLIETANRQLDPIKRVSLFYEAESILVERELPIIPIYFFVGMKLFKHEKLGGIQDNLIDEYPIREMYWKQSTFSK